MGGPCRAVIEACWGWGKVHDLAEATGLVGEVVLAWDAGCSSAVCAGKLQARRAFHSGAI